MASDRDEHQRNAARRVCVRLRRPIHETGVSTKATRASAFGMATLQSENRVAMLPAQSEEGSSAYPEIRRTIRSTSALADA